MHNTKKESLVSYINNSEENIDAFINNKFVEFWERGDFNESLDKTRIFK